MKKLSLIASLGCVLTVSSVYAQWIYGQASAGSVSESIIPQMAGVGESSKKGTISVVTSGLTIVIDDTNGDYKPELIVSGSIAVSFTANNGADADVVANGIKMSYTLSMTSGWMYDSDFDGTEDRNIFTIQNCEDIALNGGNPTKSETITADTFKTYVTLNVDPSFELNTKAKFDNFKTSLNKANSLFTLTVKEVA